MENIFQMMQHGIFIQTMLYNSNRMIITKLCVEAVEILKNKLRMPVMKVLHFNLGMAALPQQSIYFSYIFSDFILFFFHK